MFRLSKLSVTLILFFILAAVPVFAKTETNPGTSYCDCCVIPLVPWTGYGCTSRNHSGNIHTHSTLNVSCYNITSGLYQSTSQILDTHCEYGCDNATGMCIDPSDSIQYLFIVEIAIIIFIIISLLFFLIPMDEHYAGIKVGFLLMVLLGMLWMFTTLAAYGDQFGGLMGTIGSWAGSISQFFPYLILFVGALILLSFLWLMAQPNKPRRG